MTSAANYSQSALVKALYMGDSATGKTTSLCSLVAAGYKLRIYDFDILQQPLINKIKRDCPDKLPNVEIMSFRDRITTTDLGAVCANPQAYIKAAKAFDRWEDGTTPEEWGPDHIVVIDSLTTWARTAWFWARGVQGGATFAEGVSLKGFRPEAAYHTGQQGIMNLISLLTAEAFNAHVIVIAHLKYMERDGLTKGFPVALGSAISPEIPTYFPTVILAQRIGDRRTIRTASTSMIDLKNPNSFDTMPEYDMDTGLADFFKDSGVSKPAAMGPLGGVPKYHRAPAGLSPRPATNLNKGNTTCHVSQK